MRLPSFLVTLLAVAAGVAALAQAPTYNLGRPPSAEELKAWDIAIGPEGKELPPGKGTAAEGARIFSARGCSWCHGPTATEGPAPRLVGGGIGGWAFATSIWDYINRAMPLNSEGYLTPDEVYNLTAFLLHRNGIIKEGDIIDAASLPKVQMPNRNRYVPPPQWKPGMPRPFKIEP